MIRRRAAARTPVTLKDVAKEAGVSNTTASRVLTGKVSPVLISEATRLRVTQVAVRLGYKPNLLARGLRTQRSGTVGVLVADILDPFSAAMIPAITSVFAERGYQFLLSHAVVDPHADRSYDRLLGPWVDGLLVLGDYVLGREAEEEVLAQHRHVIGVSRTSENTRIPSVNIENSLGIRLALDHLLSLGHRQIGFVGNRLSWDMEKRLGVFFTAMAERGLAVPPEAVAMVPHSASGGYRAALRFMAEQVPVTAIICAADLLALGVLCGLQEAGCAVPKSMSVTGFDDIPIAAYSTPPLTTIRQPIATLAATAATMLLDAIEGVSSSDPSSASDDPESRLAPTAASEPQHIVLVPELIVRRSTAAIEGRHDS